MSIKVKEILKVRKFKAGYEVRTEIWENSGCDSTEMKAAYTPSGDYIGSSKDAYYLCKKRGIKPEKSKFDHCVCSIGFCDTENKYFGWSHRAIYGFSIGSKIEKGDCGYIPNNYNELLSDLKEEFPSDSLEIDHSDCSKSCIHSIGYKNVQYVESPEKTGITVSFEQQAYKCNPCTCDSISQCDCPDLPTPAPGEFEIIEYFFPYGKGEWEAKTLEDAKQMAIDFAESVS